MLDSQEKVAEPYPLLAKENCHDEISYLSLSGDVEQYEEEKNHPMVPIYDEYESDLGEIEPVEQNISCPEPVNKQSFPTGPIYDDYDSDLWESQEEEPEELVEQLKMKFIDCAEPVHEQPPPEINQPTLAVHPPVLTIDIQPQIHNCVAKEAACHQFSGVSH